MLRELAASGVFVTAHPDVILALGTKEVLYRTRDIGWGVIRTCIAALSNCVLSFPCGSPVGLASSSNTAAMAESAYGRSSLQAPAPF